MQNNINSINHKENIPMKTIIKLLAVSVLFLSACKSTYQTRSMYDDVYYSKKDAAVATTSSMPDTKTTNSENSSTDKNNSENSAVSNNGNSQNSNGIEAQATADDNNSPNNSSNDRISHSSTETKYDKDGNPTEITNNYYYDDYYDYEYSARLRRFHDNYNGYNYYDDYYTNYYWYTYNPWDWGLSIYCGSPWWYPSHYYFDPYYGGYYSSWGFGHSNWGWYGYNGWGNPYWNGYNNGYWNGYNDGYMDGYYASNNGYYYNSYDHNSNYYGPRTGLVPSHVTSNNNLLSFGNKYEIAVKGDNIHNNRPVTSPVNNNLPNIKESNIEPSKHLTQIPEKGGVVKNDVKSNSAIPKTVQNNAPAKQPTTVTKNTNGQNHVTPNSNNTASTPQKQNYSKPKTYVSPSYSQPKSNQYYSAPKSNYQPSNNNTTPKSENNYSQPKQENAPRQSGSTNYSAPKSSGSSNYSSPKSSGSSNNNSSPKPSSSGSPRKK